MTQNNNNNKFIISCPPNSFDDVTQWYALICYPKHVSFLCFREEREKRKAIFKELLLRQLGSSVNWASDFGSGHDLAVNGLEPHLRVCANSVEPALDSLSSSFPAPPLLEHSLFLSLKNKYTLKSPYWVQNSLRGICICYITHMWEHPDLSDQSWQ